MRKIWEGANPPPALPTPPFPDFSRGFFPPGWTEPSPNVCLVAQGTPGLIFPTNSPSGADSHKFLRIPWLSVGREEVGMDFFGMDLSCWICSNSVQHKPQGFSQIQFLFKGSNQVWCTGRGKNKKNKSNYLALLGFFGVFLGGFLLGFLMEFQSPVQERVGTQRAWSYWSRSCRRCRGVAAGRSEPGLGHSQGF